MACNESSDFQQAISHALQRLATQERLSLILVFPGQLFYPKNATLYGGYNKSQRIHKGGTTMPGDYYLNFVRAHAPEQCKRQKREQ